MLKTLISAYYCDDYSAENISRITDEIFKVLGDFSDIIKPGMKVLIKPNLLSAFEPEHAITTHPELVRAVVKKIKSFGAIPFVGDSPGNLLKGIEYVWEKTGMKKIAEEENIELVNFETAGSVELSVDHPNTKTIFLSKVITDCDVIINMPKLKTHTFMGFSCGIKNFYGIVPGARKVEYHKLAPTPYDFSGLLAEIYRMVKEKTVLTIVDAVTGIEGDGPSLHGKKRNFNFIAASQDTVALDVFILRTLKMNICSDLIKFLEDKKLGNTDMENIIYIGDKRSTFNIKNVEFPRTWMFRMIPGRLAKIISRIAGRFLWIRPEILQDKCKKCMQCVKSCPAKAIAVSSYNNKHYVNKDKCISCFCCHELCNHKAVVIKKSFLMNFFIK